MVQQTVPPVSPAPASSTKPPSSPLPSSTALTTGKSAARKGLVRKPSNVASIPFWLGLLVSIMWVGVVILIVAKSGPSRTLAGLPLVDWAIGISAIASPVALIWMITAYLQRAADIQAVAEPLRRQLSLITGESGLAETRVRRFNQAIKEQLELLKSARTSGQEDLGAIVDRIQKQRVELERFEQNSIQQVKDIQDIIRRNMQQIEHLMDDKFTMMRVLDDKLVQSGDGIAKQTDSMREKTALLLKDIEANNKHLAEALDRAIADSKRLSDTTHIQETSLTTAAASAAEILGGVSSKIDLSVARFLERAGTAREEAERLASALDTQTRALDEFSNTLPARVGEAETTLRGVAERLHSSEKSAREQATTLSGTLSKQLDGLHSFMDRFVTGMTGIDESLEKRRVDLDTLATRVTASAGNFAADWEKSAALLGDRASSTLQRFSSVNDETRKASEVAAKHLAETVEKYEDTARRLRAVTDESGTEFKGMTNQIAAHLTQFEALRDASHKAGEEVETRASAAMQSLQFVLERLLTARDSTGAVGEKLVKDLFTAVDQNEALISRLKEAAQAGAAALGTAAETVGKQQDGIIGQTKNTQKLLQEAVSEIQKTAANAVGDLRAQTGSLTSLLAEAQIQMETTDRKLQTFVAASMPPIHDAIKQIDVATATGLSSATRYGEELQAKLKGIAASSTAPLEDVARRIEGITVAGLQSASRYGDELQEKLKSLTASSVVPVQDAVKQIDSAASAGLSSAARYGDELQERLQSIAASSLIPMQDAIRQIDGITATGLQSAERYGEELQDKLRNVASVSLLPLEETARKIDETTSEKLQYATRYGEELQEKLKSIAAASLIPVQDAVKQIDGAADAGLRSMSRFGIEMQEKLQGLATASLAPVTDTLHKIDATAEKGLQSITRYGTELEKKLQGITATSLTPVQDAVNKISATTDAGLQSVNRYGAELQAKLQGIAATSVAPVEAVLGKLNATTEAGIQSVGRYGSELEEKLQGIAAASLRPVQDVLRQIDTATADGLQSTTRYGEELQERLKSIVVASLAPVEEAARRVDQTANAGLESIGRYGEELQDKLQDIAASTLIPVQDAARHIDVAATTSLHSVDRYNEELQAKLQAFIAAALPPVEQAVHKIDNAANAGMQSVNRYGSELQQKLEGIAATSLAPIAEAVKQIDGATSAGLQSTTRYGEELQAKLKTLAAAALTPMQDTIRQIDSTATAGLQSATRYGEELQTKLKSLASTAMTPVAEALKKIESAAETGTQSMSRYGTGLEEQVNRLQGFNSRVSGMGEELARLTADTVSSIEQMQGRFAEARTMQEETARQTLAQFADIAERLGREVVGLDGHAFKAVAALQEAAARVGEQSYQMLQNAETSSAKMQLVTSALQSEASQINAILQKQADDFTSGFMRSEKQFTALGDTLQQRTDAVYSLLDRVAAHYNETTRAAAEGLDARANRLGETAIEAQGKIEGLSAALGQQLTLLGAGSTQLEAHAAQIANAGSKTLSQLSAVNEKLSIAHEAANNNAQQTIARLEECNTAFLRQTNSLSEAAQGSIASVQKAGASFGEQVVKVNDANRLIEQSMRQLTSSTATLADQSTQIRANMEQQSQRLIAQLTEAVAQMDTSGAKLQQLTAVAATSTDQANARFGDLAQNASQRLSSTHEQMQDIAGKAEAALAALGSNIAQQASSLSLVGEQLAEQQRMLAAANDSQRTQLVELFDKLGSAHGQASEVAERTITHLTDALNQVQRQLGALSDQSQATVGNIRAAGTGFAEEASSLLQNAQAAEQQARTVLSVTAALQDQARQLREVLAGEGERADDMLGSLLSKLRAGGLELRDLTSNTEMALASINNGVTQQTQALSTVMQQIGERQRSLTVSLDAQRDVINGILNRLSMAQDETAAVAERATARLTDSTQQLARQAETIDTQSRTALSSLQAAATGFAHESASLTTHAGEAEQQVRGILSATVSLQEEARKMRETLDTEGARTGDILTELFAKLSQGSSQVRELGSSAESALGNVSGNIARQTETLATAMQHISERQHALSAALEAQREVLSGLLGKLAEAQETTARTAEHAAVRLGDSAEQMSNRIETIDIQSKSALASIATANAGFAAEAEALMSRAQQAEQQMRSALSATVALQEQTRQMREALDAEGARTSEILTTLLDKLAKSGDQMREAGSSAETVLGSIGGNVAEKTNVLAAAMQQINERQRILGTALDSQRDNLNGLLNRLVLAQDETAAVAERTATRLADSARVVTDQIEAMDAGARSAYASVQAANTGFGQESSALTTHAREAEQQAHAVLAVTASLQDQARQMREALSGESSRAAAALTELLDRLAVGGGQVREVAASTGASLETLSGGIGRQGSEINSVLEDVIARQRTLTAAMAEQREMIGSLLDRLALAQDEAASVGERTAAKLASGTQEIAKQLEVMGAQAQDTLATVQAAGKGFANEAETLGAHAQQAEQQVRGILASMGGLEEQGQRLREAIQAETGRVIAEMGSVIAQLDAANASTTRIASAGELVAAQFRLVEEAGTQAEARTRKLATTADEAANRLGVLGQAVVESEREGQGAFTQISSRIEAVKATLQGELQRLSDVSQQAVSSVAAAAEQLTTQSDILRANLAASESALTNAATLVRDETVQLPATLDRSASQIEAAAKALKTQANETDQALVGTADRFIAVTAIARESMVDEIRHVSSVAEEADKVLRQFTTTLAQQVTSMQQSAGMLSDEQKELVEKSGASVAQITAASNRLAQLRTDAAATAEKLAREFDALDVRVSATGQRLEKASEAATETMTALSEATTHAETKLLDATSGFREQLERIRQGLQTQIDELNRGLMQITAQLERTGSTLRSTTAGTVADVERISQRFNDTSKEASSQLTDKTSRMRDATEEVAKLLSGFGDQLDVLLDRLSMAGDGIKRHEGSLVGQLQSALQHLSGVAERLESSRTLATNVSEQAIGRLDEVVKEVHEQMQSLTSGSQAAAGIMRGIGQIYGDQTQALHHSVGEAHAEVQAMNKAVDEMQQRTDRIRVSLKLQSDELMQGLSQILKQLTVTGDALSDTVDHVLQERASDTLKKIG